MLRSICALSLCLVPAVAAADDFEGLHWGLRVQPPFAGLAEEGMQGIGVEATVRYDWMVLEADTSLHTYLHGGGHSWSLRAGAAVPLIDDLRLFATGGYLHTRTSGGGDPYQTGAYDAIGADAALSYLFGGWFDVRLSGGEYVVLGNEHAPAFAGRAALSLGFEI